MIEWSDYELDQYAVEKCSLRGHKLISVEVENRCCLNCEAITKFLISEEKSKYGGTWLYKICLKCQMLHNPEYVPKRYNE